MTSLNIALLALVATTLGGGILGMLWKGAQVAADRSEAAATSLRTELTAARAALSISETAHAGDAARLMAVVSQLRAEVASLEASLPADPAAVRDRLRVLLGAAALPVPHAGSPTGVPVDPSTQA